MTGLRSIAIAEGIVISASTGGKIKAVTQMVGIPFLIANRNFFGLPTYAMGELNCCKIYKLAAVPCN
jgi:phosphatidylglycerophosphate synthase